MPPTPRATRGRLAVVLAGLLVAVAVTVALVAAGVGLRADEDVPAAAPDPVAPTSTPLASFDTAPVSVARAEFCGAVPTSAVEEALGGGVEATSSYRNGQRADVTGRVTDVAHEFSCSWRGVTGASVRAWVFAPPVTATRASALAAAAAATAGCAEADGPRYGLPSIAVLCTSPAQQVASFRGLFGDAWLTCMVAQPDAGPGRAEPTALLERTGRWCVAVAQAASAG